MTSAHRLDTLPREVQREIIQQIMDLEIGSQGAARDTTGVPLGMNEAHDIRNRAQEQTRTIGNLRLGNRQIGSVTNEALMPVLEVHLNERSLARAEFLCSNPEIAHGIQLVEVIAAYCPKNIANDFHTWLAYKIRHSASLKSELERERDAGRPVTQELIDTMQSVWRMLTLWYRVPDSTVDEQCIENPPLAADRGIVEEAYSRFYDCYERQSALLCEGTFAKRLSKCVTKLPRLQSVHIEDTDYYTPSETAFSPRLSCREKVVKLLSDPMPWSCWPISDSNHIPDAELPEVAAVTLCCDVPIALFRAEVKLKKFYIHCYLPERSLSHFSPDDGPLGSCHQELRSAFASLETFHFDTHKIYKGSLAELRRDHHFLAEYFAAGVCGRQLREIHLDMSMHSDFYLFKSTAVDNYLNLAGTVLSLTTLFLKKVSLCAALVTREQLAQLFRRFDERTTAVQLNHLYVVDSGWTIVLPLLRAAIGPRVQSMECAFQNTGLVSEDLNERLQFALGPAYARPTIMHEVIRHMNMDNLITGYVKGSEVVEPHSRVSWLAVEDLLPRAARI